MKRLFDCKLFSVGFVQLKLIGFISLAVTAFINVVTILNTISFSRNMTGMQDIYFVQFDPTVMLLFTAVVPMMMLYLFSFLNKRSTSDYFHSLPHHRSALFVSFFAAVLVWAVLILAINEAISAVAYTTASAHFAVDWLNVLLGDLATLAGTLLVAASIGIAMTVTGTAFTNIVVSLLLIFVPRILMLVVSSAVSEQVPILLYHENMPPFGINFNTVLSILSLVFGGTSIRNIGTFWIGTVYTAAIGLLYAAAATVLFVKRKSEMAGSAAVSRRLQAVIRLSVALPFCLAPCWELIDAIMSKSMPDPLVLFNWYATAVLAFFVYELITTRKVKNLLRIIPSLGILVLINVAIVAGTLGICQYNLHITPAAEQIKSISVISPNGGYLEAKTEQVALTDSKIKQSVAKALKDTVALIDKEGVRQYYMVDRRPVMVKIVTDNQTLYRSVLMNEAAVANLEQCLQNTEAYKAVYMDLPKPAGGGLKNTSYNLITDVSVLDGAALYDTLQQEVNELGFERWSDYFNGSGEEITAMMEERLEIVTYVGSNRYTWEISLSNLLPKTIDAAMAIVNKGTTAEAFADEIQALKDHDGSLSIRYLSEDRSYSDLYFDSGLLYMLEAAEEKEQFEALVSLCRSVGDQKPSFKTGAFRCHLYYYENTGTDFVTHEKLFYLPADEQTAETLFGSLSEVLIKDW